MHGAVHDDPCRYNLFSPITIVICFLPVTFRILNHSQFSTPTIPDATPEVFLYLDKSL